MTTDTTSPLPPYDDWQGAATVFYPPPFDFQRVTMRYLPLKADFLALVRFCDNYLNLAPEVASFRPAMPFVFLVIVNYGKMSMEAGNLGWTSQNELFFSVPLCWYEVRDGRRVYKGPAQVAPFIYVDNFASQAGGREVFGWPKVQGWFTNPRVNPWAVHPRSRRSLVGLATEIRARLYAGQRPEPRQLLLIEQDPPFSLTVTPPEPGGPLNPIAGLERAITGWSTLLQKAFEMLATPAIRGYAPIDRQTLPDLVSSALGSMNVFTENLQANTINLKQFRDAVNPLDVCYQALTNARIEVTQFHAGGMLGDVALLQGDPSGGYWVRISKYDAQPIIDTLGLHVIHESEEAGVRVATLRPVLPFWQEVDLRYLAGEDLCWRTKEIHWHTGAGAAVPRPRAPDGAAVPDVHRYNTTGSAGFQVVCGPFRFPKATLRVLPLLADADRLRALCDRCLNVARATGDPTAPRFEPFGTYVYLMVTSYEDMSSESNDVGLWAGQWLEFVLPIRCYAADGTLASVATFSPFMFSPQSSGTTTTREVNGWPAVEGHIRRPPNTWLANDGPVPDVVPLLELDVDIFPALGVGQRTETRRLVEIFEGHDIAWLARTDWNHVAETWGTEVKREVERMAACARAMPEAFANLRALTLEVLGNQHPWNQVALKQFRDAADPTRACYQALVNIRTVLERIHDIREIEAPLHVRIHRYPTQPIVDTLGLAIKHRDLSAGAAVDVLQPLRPFYMKVDLRSAHAQNICWRAGTSAWRPGADRDDPTTAGYFQRTGSTSVGADLVTFLDEGVTALTPSPFSVQDHNPQRVADKRRRWHGAATQALPETLLALTDAADAVGSDVDPQMVIHAMLSREWEHWGAPRWWKREAQRDRGETPTIRQLPLFVVPRDTVGTAKDRLFPEAERVPNVGENSDYWSPPDPETRRTPRTGRRGPQKS